MKHLRGLGLLLASGLLAPASFANVSFVTPTNGASVTNPVKITFAVSGMSVQPAGTTTPKTGHHHLIIDGGAITKGQIIPSDAKHLHYGKGQTTAEVTLPKGQHTLTMQFADGTHKSYGKEFAKTITINVK